MCPRCGCTWDELSCARCGHYKGRKRAWFEIPEKDKIKNGRARINARMRRARGGK